MQCQQTVFVFNMEIKLVPLIFIFSLHFCSKIQLIKKYADKYPKNMMLYMSETSFLKIFNIGKLESFT